MLRPSLEEFSFSDDDGPENSPKPKQRIVQSDIGVGCSEIELEIDEASNLPRQNKDNKTSVMDKGTMTENCDRKAGKTIIFAEKATMTDNIGNLEPLKRLTMPEDEVDKYKPDCAQFEQIDTYKALANYEDHIKGESKKDKTSKTPRESEQKDGTGIKKESEGGKSRICHHCGFEAKTRSSLRTHKMIHDDNLKLKCNECDHRTLDATRLKFHKAKEHGGSKVPCNIEDCDFKSSKSNELRYHRSWIHRNLVHSCSSCDYTTKFLTNLKSHGITHLDKKFLCSECDYRSKTEKLLDIHINFEHKNIRFSCEKCEKEFSTATLLKEHTRVKHEGLKLVCHSCGFATAWTSRLKKHVMTCHEGVRFDCSKCSKAFSDFSSLKVHTLSVHENAIYPCKLCEFKAKRNVYLRRHVKNEHLKITYDCVGCSYKATRKHHLNQHYKSRQKCAYLSNTQ